MASLPNSSPPAPPQPRSSPLIRKKASYQSSPPLPANPPATSPTPPPPWLSTGEVARHAHSPAASHVLPRPGNDGRHAHPRPFLLKQSISPRPPPPRLNEGTIEVNIPLVIGATAGMGAFLVLFFVAYLCSLRKKKKSDDTIRYYHDRSRTQKGVRKLPPPTVSGPAPPWIATSPPPPPLATSSGELSSNAYSGAHGPPLPPPSPNIALGFNKSTFTYDELAVATDGFSEANILGQGGFGYVHKGVLPNGKEVAVKSLKSGSGQGEREFQAEVEIISRVHHRHLVSLVGYCIAGGRRMLVYEFVPNNTLEFHLHGRDRPTMDFPTRLKIALGSAKGLAYLHEDCHPKIIHRDIKAANILLDCKFEAMVADFGLAKLASDSHTHVSTRVMGTFGYLAPEYASSGKLTEKSDVFSYGVMLLELITGRRPVEQSTSTMDDSLVDWAMPLLTRALTEGNFDGLVDPQLEDNFNPNEMTRLVACAAASVRYSGRRRPKMSQMVRALEGDSSLEDLNEGIRLYGSSDLDSGCYKSQLKKFQKMALASEEFGSSEFGATSEFAPDLHSPSSGSDGYSREIRPPIHSRLGQ